MKTLTSKVVSGTKWMIAVKIIGRGGSIISALILANLLTPKEFGLVAVGSLLISLFNTLTEFGLKQSLIFESNKNAELFFNSAWSIELIRGFATFLLMFLFSNYASDFFNKPEAAEIIRALAFIPLIKSLSSPRIIFIEKEIKYKKQFLNDLSALIGPIFISIPLAFILQSVWAIVVGNLVGVLIQVFVSYYIAPCKPIFSIDLSHFTKMFGFGKWIFLGSIFSYFAMELDTYVAAKYFDITLLGIYTVGFTLANKPLIEIGKAMTKVLFPAFSIIQKDLNRLRKAYLKASHIFYIVVIPFPIILYFISSDIVELFLKDKWRGLEIVLEILSIATLFRVITVPSGSLFKGIGKPSYVFYLSFIRLFALLIPIFKDLLNLSNLSYSVLFSNITVCVSYFIILKFSLIKFSKMISYNLRLLIIIVIVTITTYFLSNYIESNIYRLIFIPSLYMLLYFYLINQFISINNKNIFKVIFRV